MNNTRYGHTTMVKYDNKEGYFLVEHTSAYHDREEAVYFAQHMVDSNDDVLGYRINVHTVEYGEFVMRENKQNG